MPVEILRVQVTDSSGEVTAENWAAFGVLLPGQEPLGLRRRVRLVQEILDLINARTSRGLTAPPRLYRRLQRRLRSR